MGLSRVRVAQMKAKGMPVGDLAAAQAWRDANVEIQVVVPRKARPPENASEGGGASPTPPEVLPLGGFGYDIGAARAKRETHEANIAEMRELRESGNLVERAAVAKASVDAGAVLRQALERLPGLSQELAAMTGPEPIRERLSVVIAEILADLSDNLRRLADPGAPDGRS
jgi:hypothetical protein